MSSATIPRDSPQRHTHRRRKEFVISVRPRSSSRFLSTPFRCAQCQATFMNQELARLHLRFEHRAIVQQTPAMLPLPNSERLIIYQQTSAYLASITCESQDRKFELVAAESYASLLSLQQSCWSTTNSVTLLATARRHRLELLQLSVNLRHRSDRRFWAALREDEIVLCSVLRQAVLDRKDEILALRNEGAVSVLNLIDVILQHRDDGPSAPSTGTDTSTETTSESEFGLRNELRRISVRLSEASMQLPEGLYLRGVCLDDPNYVASGGYANVHIGRYQCARVALKTMRGAQYTNGVPEDDLKSFYREISILHSLQHSNICHVIGVDSQTFIGTLCLVSPWMEHGNLLEYIRANSFAELEIHRFLIEIAAGLAYLHGQNVVHGDLHPNNILVDDQRRIKLTDFGLSNFADTTSASASSAATGATRYMAPESLHPIQFNVPHVRHTPASDVHSFAMCCWTVYSLQPPFPELASVQASLAIIQGERPPHRFGTHEVPTTTWEIVEQCWDAQSSRRPTSADVKSRLRRSIAAVTPSRTYSSSVSPRSSGVYSAHQLGRKTSSGNESANTSRNESDGSHRSTRQRLYEARVAASARSSPRPSPRRPRRATTIVEVGAAPVCREAANTVRLIACTYPGRERLVPQFVYRPTTAHLSDMVSVKPIVFYVRTAVGCGIPCADALQGRFADLVAPSDVVDCSEHMRLRIMWPDYEPWTSLVTVGSGVTFSSLAKLISHWVSMFIEESQMYSVKQESRWKIGAGRITIADLELVGLQPVAVGNWQVHLRVRKRSSRSHDTVWSTAQR